MRSPASSQVSRYLLGASGPLAALIFLVDIRTPVDYYVSVAYVLVILLGLGIDWARYPVVAAAASTGLALVTATLGGEMPPGPVYVNDALIVALFWGSAALLVRLRR